MAAADGSRHESGAVKYLAIRCPSCGAPLSPPEGRATVRCDFCLSILEASPEGWRAGSASSEEPASDPDRPRLWVGKVRYALEGRMARGDSSDVFLARRDARVTERVLIKILRAPADLDLLESEWKTLVALQESNSQGGPHFTRLLPQPVAQGIARLGRTGQEGERPAAVYRWRSGFVHTFESVRAAYPCGVEAESSVWLLKRVLEQLGWIHRAGWIHGAVLPRHLVVHARDHGVALVGWSAAAPVAPARRLRARALRDHDFYPREVWNGAPATAATDIACSARSVLYVLGGDPAAGKAPSRTPRPLARLIEDAAAPKAGANLHAWEFRDRLDEAARSVFGTPRFVPFAMPGWSSNTVD